MTDAPEMPKGGIIVDGALTGPGQSYLEQLTESVKTLSRTVSALPTGEFGDLASKDTIERTDLASGFGSIILQRTEVDVETGVISLSTIPYDLTIPQISEGTEVLTGSFTPLSATSTIAIRAQIMMGAPSGASAIAIAALFINGAADAVMAAMQSMASANWPAHLMFEFLLPSSGTDPITLSVRAGAHSGTSYLNGSASGLILGGVLRSNIVVTEYEAI